ncbi:MAG: LrgB family protein [Clostridium butyricum]|nr:LrgB family protein [Clostridium butyricum]
MEMITNNLLFALVLSLASFEIGIYINRKTKFSLLNPLLIGIIITITFLMVFNIDYETYDNGGKFINMFLGPATVVLAVPLYKQLNLLKKNAKAIFIGIFFGTVIGIVSIICISHLVGLDDTIIKSLAPKSVTTPIGISISEQIDGIVPITVLAIVATGIIGAVIGPTVCKICRIEDEVAVGIAIGTASHAVGTSKAIELGEVQGAMSSLSIGIAGIMTVVLAPLILKLSSYIF